MEMARTMTVNKWGNSLGIRFPSDFVELINLKEKSLVEIKADGEQLIIKKIGDTSPRRTIQELFELYPADYIEDTEIDWGSPVGGEIW